MLNAGLTAEFEIDIDLSERTPGFRSVQMSWSADDRFLSVSPVLDARSALIDRTLERAVSFEAATAGFISERELLTNRDPAGEQRSVVLTITTLDQIAARTLPEAGSVGQTSPTTGVALVIFPPILLDSWSALRTLEDGPEEIVLPLSQALHLFPLTDESRAALREAGVLVSRDADGRCP